MKQNLGFAEGVLKGMTQQNTGVSKVFDWDKCAEIIREKLKENPDIYCQAGLAEDWNYTSGAIFSEGKPVEEDRTYVFLESSWATPILDIDGEEIECWVYVNETNRFGAKSYWDEKSLEILNSNN